MTITRTASAVAVVLVLYSNVSAQDALARAKDLYASAAYDEALALLNQFDNGSSNNIVEVDQYRAFCLLALGRSDDARKVIQQIVETSPSFRPSEAQASPRLQQTFQDVRRRVLPSIVRQSYADGKAAFERKDFDLAMRRFDSVITLLNDPDIGGPDELKDLQTLSSGFQDLIRTSKAQAAAPSAQPSVLVAASPVREAPAAEEIFGLEDPGVVAATPISQAMPPWNPSTNEKRSYQGRLTLVIDEKGDVTSVSLAGVLPSPYGAMLRRAASQWKFRPATRNGAAVKFRKIVSVVLNPASPSGR